MTQNIARLATLLSVIVSMGGCAASPKWGAAGGARDLGVVRVSYEFSGAEPAMNAAKADQIAASRCSTWGYSRAELIPGQVRDCMNDEGDRCSLMKVTREYRCESAPALASNLAR